MEALSATLDRTYVEHDAFGLFQELMKPSKSFYEWRSEEGPVS
jgi:TBC1 domain family protein 5